MSETSRSLVEDSRAVLHTRARSFRWGSAFLPAEQADDAAIVYALCRLIDDTADEAPDKAVADKELARLHDELLGDAEARPLVAAYREVAKRRSIDDRAALELIAGCQTDLSEVRVEDDGELLRYAYRVAGTVGLMMCGVLGVDDRDAVPRAIDLGIAMQLTNICRDVAEDAQLGRIYLPHTRLVAAGVDPESLLGTSEQPATPAELQKAYPVVHDLLELAERYYASAEIGIVCIPARARLAILVAARLYRAIGLRIMSRGPSAVTKRTVVGPLAKMGWVAAAGQTFVRQMALAAASRSMPLEPHPVELHLALKGFPGVSAG